MCGWSHRERRGNERNACSCRQQSVCPSGLGGGLKIHCTQVRMGSSPIADMSGWSHSAVAWGGFKIHASAADMCGWSHRERRGNERNACSCRQQSVCPSGLGGGLKIHCTQVRMGSNPIADTCGWRHTERKETKGARVLPERHAFSLNFFLSGPTLKTSPISQCHQQCQRHQHWLLAGSSQFAQVVKGMDLRSTARKCAWVRTP